MTDRSYHRWHLLSSTTHSLVEIVADEGFNGGVHGIIAIIGNDLLDPDVCRVIGQCLVIRQVGKVGHLLNVLLDLQSQSQSQPLISISQINMCHPHCYIRLHKWHLAVCSEAEI